MNEEMARFRIRHAVEADWRQLMHVDELVSGVLKPDYWQDLFATLREKRPGGERYIYLAQRIAPDGGGGEVIAFVIGEVRAWEFGSEPCGWVFALSVVPQAREERVGEALMKQIQEAFKERGVRIVRTMIARDNHLLMSFFRSEGMTAGPYIQLEKELE
jgi:GNAT superfamily N-acetyltransferase